MNKGAHLGAVVLSYGYGLVQYQRESSEIIPVVTHAASFLRLFSKFGGDVNRTSIALVGSLSPLSSEICIWTVSITFQTTFVSYISSIFSYESR